MFKTRFMDLINTISCWIINSGHLAICEDGEVYQVSCDPHYYEDELSEKGDKFWCRITGPKNQAYRVLPTPSWYWYADKIAFGIVSFVSYPTEDTARNLIDVLYDSETRNKYGLDFTGKVDQLINAFFNGNVDEVLFGDNKISIEQSQEVWK